MSLQDTLLHWSFQKIAQENKRGWGEAFQRTVFSSLCYHRKEKWKPIFHTAARVLFLKHALYSSTPLTEPLLWLSIALGRHILPYCGLWQNLQSHLKPLSYGSQCYTRLAHCFLIQGKFFPILEPLKFMLHLKHSCPGLCSAESFPSFWSQITFPTQRYHGHQI